MRSPEVSARARRLMILATVATVGLFSGCGGDDDDDQLPPITVGAEQEEAMCSTLDASPTSTVSLKTAGSSMESCGAVSAQGTLNLVTLADFEGQKGGYLRISIPPEDLAPVFMLVNEAMDVTVVREDGEEVDFLDPGDESQPCEVASDRLLWVVEGSENYIRFGPTNQNDVHIVLEVVEE